MVGAGRWARRPLAGPPKALTATRAGLRVPLAGGSAPLGTALTRKPYMGTDRCLCKSPRPPSWWAPAVWELASLARPP